MRNAAMITDYLGNDLSHISNELGKIILNLPEGSNVTGEVIEEYIGINKEYNSFELTNALGHRNIDKVTRIILFFGQNEKKFPMPQLMATLYNYFSKVLKFQYMGGLPKNEKATQLGVHPYFLKDYELAVRHYNRTKLVDIIDVLHEYDLKSKGVGSNMTSSGELLKEMTHKIMH